MNESESSFASYLEGRRLPFEYERPIGDKAPDFTIDHPKGTVVCDVYDPTLRLPNRVGSIDPYEAIRKFERKKRGQAGAASDAGHPFVLVLGSRNSDLPFDEINVPGAMFGNLTLRVPLTLDPDEPPPVEAEVTTFFGDGGKLNPRDRTRYSAIAVLKSFNPTLRLVQDAIRERTQPEPDRATGIAIIVRTLDEFTESGLFDELASEVRLQVFHSPWARYPVDRTVFAGPYDEQWSVTPDGHYARTVAGDRVHELPN